jgi:hypothetical protein
MSTPAEASAATKAGPRFDLPTVEAESLPFWHAAREGRLMIGACADCTRLHYYPRPFCPHCWSEKVSLRPASGRGTLYTWSTIYMNDLPPFKERLPYVAAIVDLEEGVRVSTNIVECAVANLAVGMAVQLVFEHRTPELSLAVFKPA